MRSKTTLASLAVVAGLAAGCQSYEPRPLNLEEHRDAWLARSPDSERVIAFARRLEQQGDEARAFDPSDGITRREAEVIALVFNPDLRLARLRAGVATATAEHAGLWDDPELSIDVLRVTESVSNPWVITPGLAFTIPISGRLEAEKARADAAARAELDRVAEDEWRIRHEVRRTWLEWSAARLRAGETERLFTSMESVVSSTARLVETGEMPRTEASLFAIEQMERRQELHRLRGEIAVGEQRLRMLLGLSPDAPISFVPALDAGLPVGSPETGPDALAERNPTLSRLRDEYDVTEQALRREIRKQYPDLTIGPLYETDQGQSRVGFLGALPLPLLNANKQGIAEAEAERELARATFETGYERLVGSLAAARVRAEALRVQREEIASVMAPLVDRQVADARRLFELGEGDAIVFLESLVRAQETKMQLLDVRLDEALALAELAFIIGPEPPPTTPNTDDSAPDAGREVTP